MNNLLYWIVINNLWNFNNWLHNTCLNLKTVVNNNQFITWGGKLSIWMIFLRNNFLRLIAPTDQVIFKKFCISRFYNSSAMRWTIKYVPFRPFSISNEISTNGPRVQLLFLWIVDSHFRRISPNTYMSQTRFPTFP